MPVVEAVPVSVDVPADAAVVIAATATPVEVKPVEGKQAVADAAFGVAVELQPWEAVVLPARQLKRVFLGLGWGSMEEGAPIGWERGSKAKGGEGRRAQGKGGGLCSNEEGGTVQVGAG